MRETYGFRLSRQDARLFEAWSKADPVDDWERKRQARIARLKGVEKLLQCDRLRRSDLDPSSFPPSPQARTEARTAQGGRLRV
jgi:hypothetical protein